MKTITKSFTATPTLRAMAFVLLTFICSTMLAQEAPDNNKSGSPYFFVLSNDPAVDGLPLKKTHAEVRITGVIADVIVTQEYKNEGTHPLEAIYTFPASANAAVYGMEMVVGNRRIVARIEEKKKARIEYDQAKADGKRASLLEQERPNVFQMNVANIMPGDIIKVTLRYTELLVPEEGTYRFVFPTVVGPRYSGEKPEANTFVNTPYQKEGIAPANDFDIDLNLSTGVPIQHLASVSHQVTTNYISNNVAKVALSPDQKKSGNRDFVLEFKLAGNQIESGLMLYEHGDENFFLLMVQPPKRIIKEELPPREYIFIVDVSGSMHGFPIETAKVLMRNLVVNLRPIDRFNVLVFESGAHWLADESLAATLENVEKVNSFFTAQHGGGGTNLLAAMNKALTFPRKEEGLSRSFVIVTDGYVNVEKEVFDIIRSKADEANVFSFGIGSSVNRYIIEGMAHAGMSEPFIVLGPEQAALESDKFRKYINYPVLTQIKKSFSGIDVYDVEPLSIPDVLAERPVIIFGKYRGKPQGTITLEGSSGKKKYKKTFSVGDTKPDKKHAALRYLWARKKIQLLDDYGTLSGSGQIGEEVTQLGLKYNLLTRQTSFIAVEEQIVNTEKALTTVKQPLPLPQGVENSAIGFEMEVEEEVSFSFHKKIVLPADFDRASKDKVMADVEKNIIPELNRYLRTHAVSLDLIEVTVDEEGRVSNVLIQGKNVSKEARGAILKFIQKQLYAKYKLSRGWKFKIVF
jgi:Ca-activated chloride channel homolog